MVKTILTTKQTSLLKQLFLQTDIFSHFYLTGGTALSEYYLHHRYSEDLDLFSEMEVDPFTIQIILKKLIPILKIKKIDFQQSYNRNLFFLHFENEVIKTEFTYFPFSEIEKPHAVDHVIVESLIDIAVNKTFTIYQNPRSRDFIDLYLILQKKQWKFDNLLQKARIKFDTHIDPLQLGQQLLQVTELKDYPRMLHKTAPSVWQNFWLEEARKLKKKALLN
ncbi:MAG: nucleotidyl transferase AbiEii/AbiGii toxin family protein [Patescibacteria group bacterium]